MPAGGGPQGRKEDIGLKIAVKTSDAEYAERQNRWGCAIVRAIQRDNPDAIRVRVDTDKIAYTVGERRYTFPTPAVAVKKVIEPFDKTGTFKPCLFVLTDGESSPLERKSPDKRRKDRDRGRIERAKGNPCYTSKHRNRFLDGD